MGLIASSIKEKLEKAFNPDILEVIDESHKHAHHKGAKEHAQVHGSGESHFLVRISAKKLNEMGRLARHRAVMAELDELMRAKIHALRLEII